MNTVLLDIGNSRIKWALTEASEQTAQKSAPLYASALPHGGDPVAGVSKIIEQLPATVQLACVADVTGTAQNAPLKELLSARLASIQIATVAAALNGLHVAYAQPQRLGIDRWLAMLALWREVRDSFVVVSAGTALTFDAVDANGRHLGGVIAPGLMAMQTAVLGTTRFAADAAKNSYDAGLGTDTEACVRQGALHAAAGLIERLSSRYANHGARAVLTGGDAAILMPQLAGQWQQRPDLVLEGLLTLSSPKI